MDQDAICNHCGERWTATEVEDATPDEIPHFWERVEPGDVMPLGICPTCEGLCLPQWGAAYTASQQVVELCESIAQLLEWSEQMGGWDAPCWGRARRLLRLCAR